MLRNFDDFIMASAPFPDDLEFHVFWKECFDRMDKSEKQFHWNEPRVASYMKENLFNAFNKYYQAPWQYGNGAVPLGYTTYAVNAIERSHRLLKHLHFNSVAEAMV